jgi:hypothetical protein
MSFGGWSVVQQVNGKRITRRESARRAWRNARTDYQQKDDRLIEKALRDAEWVELFGQWIDRRLGNNTRQDMIDFQQNIDLVVFQHCDQTERRSGFGQGAVIQTRNVLKRFKMRCDMQNRFLVLFDIRQSCSEFSKFMIAKHWDWSEIHSSRDHEKDFQNGMARLDFEIYNK